MTVLQQIEDVCIHLRSAIENKDWYLVLDALKLLDGDEPEIPDDNDVLSQLMKRLDNLELGTSQKTKPSKSRVPKTPEITNPSSRGRKGKIHNGKPNKFEEMTDLLSEVEKEPGYDAIKESKTRVKRRPPYKPAKVKCSRCHQTYEVSPKLARENFVCDDCIGK